MRFQVEERAEAKSAEAKSAQETPGNSNAVYVTHIFQIGIDGGRKQAFSCSTFSKLPEGCHRFGSRDKNTLSCISFF